MEKIMTFTIYQEDSTMKKHSVIFRSLWDYLEKICQKSTQIAFVILFLNFIFHSLEVFAQQGSPFRINTYTSGDQTNPAISMSPDGRFVVVWQTPTSSYYSIYGQLYDASGNAVGSEFHISMSDHCTEPLVAMDSNGNFVVVWRANNQGESGAANIYGQKFNSSGVKVGSAFLINTYTSGDQTNTAMSMLPDGRFVVVWQTPTASYYCVYGQLYDASGNPVGSEFHISMSDHCTEPLVKMDSNGNFVVVWRANNQGESGAANIYGQRFNASGVILGSAFLINTYTSGDQTYPAMSMAQDGRFVVVWQTPTASYYCVYGQLYNASGNAVGSEFHISMSDHCTEPLVAMDSNGNFVVVWRVNNQGESGAANIYGQRFNSSGVKVGSEFRINTYTSGDQTYPAMSMAQDGRFVVVWQTPTASYYCVYGQLYDASGNPVGSEFHISMSDHCTEPLVNMDSNGNFVVVWRANNQGESGAANIFGQMGIMTAISEGTLKWSYRTGHYVNSSPAVGVDGTIYFGSSDNKLYALNKDGTLKWNYTVGNWIYSGPAIGADNTIYFGSHDKNVYALNPDGSLKWSYTTGGTVYSSPAIGVNGTIYVGSSDYRLYALNTDGTLKWYYSTGNAVCSSPAIGTDSTIYFGSWDDKIYALNPDGSLKWSYTTGDIVYASPAIGADGTIYIGSYDNNLYALNSNGTLKWSFNTGGDVYSNPAIGVDNTIYFGSWDDKIYALNPDGSLKWSYTTGNDVRCSPAIGLNGMIYVGSYDNNLYALNSDGTLKWNFATGNSIFSSPVIVLDGTIYFGSKDSVFYAIYSSSMGLANSPWPKSRHDLQNTGRYGTVTGVSENDFKTLIPNLFSLEQNYPNPFNPQTNIKFSLPSVSNVIIKIYDILGREVKMVLSEQRGAGTHSVIWDGTNNAGQKVASGIYIYRMQAGSFTAVKRMVLIR
jgi:outer membrane protein assembly factor BamB